ncbi:hypothetical protein Tb09.160.1670 [Trypanosoma brucei brucei TREU927]|uniref:Uncharacterized protein n=1 Tax=Trypanosoma brucei brucei (strain 927/4 GUTat10.1) TaxID=185431 RepID=Q38FM4_TRYB2|nr:hypothetical protein Tb09.160.1670 [Trypanosoma brucei brucei TREU927]EAN76396.1 hypothetical protein Tb09.160.1670 [Trypanosoma brucei brucei TREU927]
MEEAKENVQLDAGGGEYSREREVAVQSAAADGFTVDRGDADAAFAADFLSPVHKKSPSLCGSCDGEFFGKMQSPGSCATEGVTAFYAAAENEINIDVESGDNHDIPAITIWVPTAFTKAAGRRICIREQRCITQDSPYWRLLNECPLAEGFADNTEVEEKQTGDSHQQYPRSLQPHWRRRRRESNVFLSPMPYEESFATLPRCRSCPSSLGSRISWEN